MNSISQKSRILRFSSWMSIFPFEASSTRLHEISWVEAYAGFSFSAVDIKRLLFLYTTGGSGILRYKGAEYTLKHGDSFIVDMNQGVEVSSSSTEWSFIWLQMSSSLAYELLKYVESSRGNVIAACTEVPILCDQIYSFAKSGTWSSRADIEISSLLYRLIGLVLISTVQNHRLEHTLIHIHKHYMEELRLAQLAKISCMSLYHFIRCFRREIGMTPHEYINEYRIKIAQDLLIRSEMAISSIASAVGFGDPSYFAELFKKVTGCLPREHRKLYKRDK